MNSGSNILIIKLDEFIRKYYKNELIKGLLYSTGLLLGLFLFLVITEYYGEFSIPVRTFLFYTFLLASGFTLTRFIVFPLLKLNKLGKIISYEEAALIIGSHFKHINDKLINTLQLQQQSGSILSYQLLEASVNQKIEELKPIPFSGAINLAENKKYLKYVLPPLVIFLLIMILKPVMIKDATERILFHQTYFEKKAPFSFNLINKSLSAIQQEDYNLQLEIDGDKVPNEVYILVNGVEHRMDKEDRTHFNYTFKNLQNNQDFVFLAAGFNSKQYKLNVLPKPLLVKFDIKIQYPAYLNKKDEVISNLGDLQIPEGSKLTWTFNTKNTNALTLRFTDSIAKPEQKNQDLFSFSAKFKKSTLYTIKSENNFITYNPDSITYQLSVIPDQFPTINIEEKKDSLNPKMIYFSGGIKDDYGFNQLQFKYTIYTTDSSDKPVTKFAQQIIPIQKTQINQAIYHYFNASQFEIKAGDKIEYYFEVCDNDGVNGSKCSKSEVMLFKAPTIDELNEATSKSNSEIKKELDESIKKAKDIQKEINELSKKLTEKKQMDWEEKKKLEDLLKKQNDLKNKIEQAKQENALNNQQQQEYNQPDESILEKQKQLEELFENIMTPEMKKLFDELNKLMEKMDKNQVQQKLEELKLTNKDIEKELDRTLEAFKQMEVEQKLQQAIDRLNDLKNKQEALKKETEGNKESKEKEGIKEGQEKKDENKIDSNNKDQKTDNNKPETTSKELEKKQNELNKDFEDLKKDLKDLQEKNSSLESPNEIPKSEDLKNEISNEMQKSSDQLNQNNKKNATKSQKNAAEKMNEMQQNMQQSLDKMQQEEPEEDMQALRQILENLLHLSFSQEELMQRLSKIKINDPLYTKIPQQQKKLQDDSKIIEDSLLALSKRVPTISATVNREISAINMNMSKAVSELAERMQSNAQMRMQYSMTSINNLALMLNESLEQMQKQAKESKKSGSGSKCKKPGKNSSPSSKPSMQSMKQMQEQLNKQLEELKKALEKGQKPGGEKAGEKPGQKPGGQNGMGQQGKNGMMPMPGGQGMSEQLAKMAAQQEAIRRQMQELMDKIKKEGKGNPGGNITDLMEQTEKDIVNKRITQETMKRQQEILTKLLESEKAEREREQDEQRKSNEAKNQNFSNPSQFLEYKRLKEKELELLNTVSPNLTPYYKEKVNEYFNNVNR